VTGQHVGEQTDGERHQAEHLAEHVRAEDELPHDGRSALDHPAFDVAEAALGLHSGVVREEERTGRQGDGDVQVAGGRIEGQLSVLANRQRDEAEEVEQQDERERGADVRDQYLRRRASRSC